MTPELTWLGHASVLVEIDGVRVLTDPFLGRGIGPLRRVGPMPAEELYRDIDLVLVSHLHHDHLDLPSLRRVGAPVVVPSGGAALVPGATEVRNDDRRTIAGVDIEVVAAAHPTDRLGSSAHAAPVGYVIRRGGYAVYFAGDTGPIAAPCHDVDAALLPVGGWGLTLGAGHLDPEQAARLAADIRPRMAVPIHWGTLQLPVLRHLRPGIGRDAGRRFVAALAQVAPTVRGVVAPPGEPLSLT